MQVDIRPGAAADIHAIRDLLSSSIRSFYHTACSPAQIEVLLQRQINGLCPTKQSLLVAEIAGKIVGFAALSRWEFQIDAVYVHTDYFRQGIGQQLVAALEQVAQQQQYPKLVVIAALVTTGFYQAQGYRVICDYIYELEKQEPVPCHVLEKSFASANVPFWRKFPQWQRELILGSLILAGLFGSHVYRSIQPRSTDLPEQSILRPDRRD
jgi:putative acetyltransferase